MLLSDAIGWRVSEFTNAGGWLGFNVDNSVWTSDGTAQGTSSEIGGEFILSDLTGGNGSLYYAVDGYLWYTAGPGGGGSPVVEYYEGDTTSWQINQLTNVNGTLFYSATDKNATTGRELWAYTHEPHETRRDNLQAAVVKGHAVFVADGSVRLARCGIN